MITLSFCPALPHLLRLLRPLGSHILILPLTEVSEVFLLEIRWLTGTARILREDVGRHVVCWAVQEGNALAWSSLPTQQLANSTGFRPTPSVL
jgi:hypothetical protein